MIEDEDFVRYCFNNPLYIHCIRVGLVYFGTIQGYNLVQHYSACPQYSYFSSCCWCLWGEMNKFTSEQELFPQTYYLDNKNMLPTIFVELKRIQDVFSAKSTFLVVLLTVVVAAVESLSACCCPQSGNLCSLMSLVFHCSPGSLLTFLSERPFLAISDTRPYSDRRLLVAAQLLSRQVYDYFTAFELQTKTHWCHQPRCLDNWWTGPWWPMWIWLTLARHWHHPGGAGGSHHLISNHPLTQVHITHQPHIWEHCIVRMKLICMVRSINGHIIFLFIWEWVAPRVNVEWSLTIVIVHRGGR